jgi:hypothetical protein
MSNTTELRISGQGISSFLLLLCIAMGFWFQGSSAGFQDSEHGDQVLEIGICLLLVLVLTFFSLLQFL